MAADACYEQEELAELAERIYRFMMTRPDPWDWLERAQEGCAADAQALEGGEAVALMLSDAREQLAALRRDAEGTLALCRGEGGPAHYAAAAQEDVALLCGLEGSAGRGYGALAAALDGAAFAALGRKKKGDVFDEDIAEAIKTRRDALKKAVKGLAGQFSLTLEEAAEDLRLTQAPLRGLATLIRTYDALYGAAKRRRGVMDFNDLEHQALRALRLPAVQGALRAQYRYVFVDEYQDSSAIQEAILGSFAREDGWFCVGDVKQSIYRFRQAEPALFLEKAARWDGDDTPLCRRIDLQRNFRSRANVLEGVNAVFERIMRADVTEIEYDARERLIPGLPVREDDPPLELHILGRAQAEPDAPDAQAPDEEEEAVEDEAAESERELAAIEREALIACARIRELVGTPFYDAKTGGERPLAYRDMAILMRVSRGSAPLAADILQQEGIPAFCDAGEGYFDIPEIRAIMALLETVDNGAKDAALLASLRGPACGLSDAELAGIRMHTPDTRVPYHEAARRYMEEKDDALSERLRAFEARLSRWRLCARHQGVDALIERIYGETGFVAQAGALPGGAARQANLHLLVSRARAYMQAQGGSLTGFLRYAQRLHAGGDSMSASAIGENEDVVRIMTTHKSKGLEFPVVFVLGMGRKMSGQSLRARVLLDGTLGIGLPCVDIALHSERDTLLRRAMRLKAQREQLAEEVRILYVAMTRARERLILVGSTAQPPERWRTAEGAAALRGMRTELDMVAPVLAAHGAGLNIREEEITAGDSRWRVFAHVDGGTAGDMRRSDERVQRLLAQLAAAEPGDAAGVLGFTPGAGVRAVRKTSVSAVLRDEKRAADDELHQHDVELMRLPRFMQERTMTGAQIGTAFHRAMCMIDLDRLRGAPSLEGAVRGELARMREAGVLSAAEYGTVTPQMLVRLFASPVGVRLLESPRVEREWAFTYKRTAADGAQQLIQGIVDCCFVEDERWVLVDYKTDRDVKGAIERHRGQLDLYAEALQRITGMPVSGRVLYMVRAGIGYSI